MSKIQLYKNRALEAFSALPPRDRMLAAGLIVSTFFGGLGFGAYSMNTTLKTERQEIERIEKSVELIQVLQAEQASLESEVAQIEESLAMRYSKSNPELMEKWLASSKRAYALPKVNLQYEKQLDEGTRYDYVAGVDGNIESQADYVQIGNDDKVVVKLEWRLDKLVMSSEQIRVINETGKANKMREKVLDEVTRLYFDRRRLQVDNLLNPPSSLSDQIDMELRLQEMTANLDALTGGEFSASF